MFIKDALPEVSDEVMKALVDYSPQMKNHGELKETLESGWTAVTHN